MNYYNYMNNIGNMNTMNNMNNANIQLPSIYDPYQGFIRGNLFRDLYSPYKLNKPYDIEPANEQARMLTSIDALKFAMIDLNLYLDIYPNSKEYIDLFNRYRVEVNGLIKEYENKYGPLNLNSDVMMSYPWAWDKTPWPRES